jgi:hypothetical protein
VIALCMIEVVRCMRRAVIRRLDALPHDVSFANPGSLSVWEDDGDGMVVGLEFSHERENVWRGVRGRRAIVVCNKDMHADGGAAGGLNSKTEKKLRRHRGRWDSAGLK